MFLIDYSIAVNIFYLAFCCAVNALWGLQRKSFFRLNEKYLQKSLVVLNYNNTFAVY